MSRFRIVGAVLAGMAAWSFASSLIGYFVAQLLIWLPLLSGVFLFPSGHFPIVAYFTMDLPSMVLGSIVATKICGRAKEFTIAMAAVAVIWVIEAAEASGIDLTAVAPHAVKIICAGFCLFVDQNAPG